MSDTQLNTSAAVGLAQDSKSPKKKMVWLEMLRIFAVYLVIFNHTGDYGFHYWATLDGGYRYWLFMGCASLTVMNIPAHGQGREPEDCLAKTGAPVRAGHPHLHVRPVPVDLLPRRRRLPGKLQPLGMVRDDALREHHRAVLVPL